MRQFSYDLVKGYPIAELRGRKFLVDTALPFTVAERPVVIEGKRYEAEPEVMGLNAAQMETVAGLKLDGILGGNITDQFVVKLKSEQHKLVLDHYLDAFPVEIDIDNLAGMAVMNQTIAGRRMKAFLTLGTRLSYVSREFVEGLQPVGRTRDLLGIVGEIETDIYKLSVAFDRNIHQFHFGVLPAEVESFLELANVNAAIGSEVLQHYDLTLSLEEGVLMLDPLSSMVH